MEEVMRVGPQDGISAFIRRDQRACSPHLSPLDVRIQRKDYHLHNRKLSLTRSQISQGFDLGLTVSRVVRNQLLLFKPPTLWYFVMTAQADSDSM